MYKWVVCQREGYTIYDKDKMSDLTKVQRETLKQMLKNELYERRKQ